MAGSGVGQIGIAGIGAAEIAVALVFVHDTRGFLLMQHRDEHAPKHKNLWGTPGGRIEPGEIPVEAAHRELFEETGLVVPNLRPFWSGPNPDTADPVMFYAFHGTTTATQDDVVLGEGQAMVFVDPRDIDRLDVTPWTPTLLKALEHHMQADVSRGGVVERLRHGREDFETQ